ncbi:8725_t:CDS:2 [Paraglomus occultum]|uniref:8725_t:CDS:1 n=1 Tax=Paraglomus occultum TaxID=144539 RepID=A0A9N9BB00_9GLOM|nr:8725_t:CDS:2 [Paraglomus occultum]
MRPIFTCTWRNTARLNVTTFIRRNSNCTQNKVNFKIGNAFMLRQKPWPGHTDVSATRLRTLLQDHFQRVDSRLFKVSYNIPLVSRSQLPRNAIFFHHKIIPSRSYSTNPRAPIPRDGLKIIATLGGVALTAILFPTFVLFAITGALAFGAYRFLRRMFDIYSPSGRLSNSSIVYPPDTPLSRMFKEAFRGDFIQPFSRTQPAVDQLYSEAVSKIQKACETSLSDLKYDLGYSSHFSAVFTAPYSTSSSSVNTSGSYGNYQKREIAIEFMVMGATDEQGIVRAVGEVNGTLAVKKITVVMIPSRRKYDIPLNVEEEGHGDIFEAEYRDVK